jgi:hypothetical protein
MKTLLRTSALTASLALTVLAAGRATINFPPPSSGSGTCRTTCYGSPNVTVSWLSSQEGCCSDTGASHCPAGTLPSGWTSYQPSGGFAGFCPNT